MGDTAEAIDFLEYYARQMLALADSSARLTPYPPEQLSLVYIPLGVGASDPALELPDGDPDRDAGGDAGGREHSGL